MPIANTCSPTFSSLESPIFIGVRIELAGEFHYGWGRLNASGTRGQNAVVIYKDFAYNAMADASIVAGDTGSASIGMAETVLQSISVYPNPSSDFITIESSETSVIESLTVYSITGKMILRKTDVSTKERIDIRSLDRGSYFIALQPQNGAIYTVKWIKE